MIKISKYKVINSLIRLIILTFILSLITKNYKSFLPVEAYIFIIIGYLIYVISLFINFQDKIKIDIYFISYLFILIPILFVRHKVINTYSNGLYLFNWLRLITSNKIILINVIGNIILYIPMYYYLSIKNGFNKSLNIMIVLIIIISNELLQCLLKVGVFDIADIVLNLVGIVMFVIIQEICNLYGEKHV